MSWLLGAAAVVVFVLMLAVVELHVLAGRRRRADETAQRELDELRRRHVHVRRIDRDDWGIEGWIE